jgi:hypothetical protein
MDLAEETDGDPARLAAAIEAAGLARTAKAAKAAERKRLRAAKEDVMEEEESREAGEQGAPASAAEGSIAADDDAGAVNDSVSARPVRTASSSHKKMRKKKEAPVSLAGAEDKEVVSE